MPPDVPNVPSIRCESEDRSNTPNWECATTDDGPSVVSSNCEESEGDGSHEDLNLRNVQFSEEALQVFRCWR